nr:hypothetical protein [uncultured Acetatifactor sp.]
MKKIINNKLYDTDTATYIDNYEYGNSGDFSHVRETLYQKKTGEFFLHGEGGPKSKYAECRGDRSWSGGEDIIPECDFDVKEWVAVHCDADTYIKLFGPVEE